MFGKIKVKNKVFFQQFFPKHRVLLVRNFFREKLHEIFKSHTRVKVGDVSVLPTKGAFRNKGLNLNTGFCR